MRISRISIAGFRGVRGRIDLALDDGFLVLTGRNGSGKSTVCDAIEFALTGSLSRFSDRKKEKEKDESIADYIWWRGELPAEERVVVITFETDGGEQVSVERRPETARIDVAARYADKFCESGGPSVDWTADLIDTTFIRDENINALSVDLSDLNRFAVVERALRVAGTAQKEELVANAVKRIVEQREAAEREHAAVATKVLDLTEDLARLRGSSVSAEMAEDALVALQAELPGVIASVFDTKSVAKEVSNARSQLKMVEVLRNELGEAIRHREDLDRQLHEPRTIATRTEMLEVETTIVKSEARLAAIERESAEASLGLAKETSLAQLADVGSKLGLVDGRCPLCNSAVSPSRFEDELLRIRSEVGAASQRQANLLAERAQETVLLADARARQIQFRQYLSSIERAMDSAKARAADLASRLSKMTEQTVSSSDEVSGWLETHGDALIRMEQAVAVLEAARLVDSAAESERELGGIKKDAEGLAARVAKLRRGEESLKELLRVVKQASKELVDQRFASTTPILTEFYRRLRPHSEWRDVSYRIRGDIRKYLSFSVGDGINPSFVFSSGQRRAAGIAFLFAVHLARNWCRLKTLILDDPVQHIDDFRALHLVEVLSAIRKVGRQVICTVEDPALADLLVRRLQVPPMQGGSRVELRYDPALGVVVNQERRVYCLVQNVLRTA